MQFGFGSGSLWGINSVANSTPVPFGALQDCALDFSFSVKELRGRGQFPLTVARGAGKITGKAKTGNISAQMYNELFFGQALSTGKTTVAQNEAASVPGAAGPYTITAANGATFVEDLGVLDAITATPLVKVAAAPVVGQYSVSAAGVYTFAAADADKDVLLNYSYTTTGGSTITISNRQMGTTPFFGITLNQAYEGKQVTVRLYKCTSSKMGFATKLEDFVIPELDFQAMANAAGVIGVISIDE